MSPPPNPIITISFHELPPISAELFPDIAPNTVYNFIALASNSFFDGLSFHRIIPGFMIQGGCPLGNGTGNPGYSIPGEFAANNFPNPIKHRRGVLSMARAAHPDSAGSQFFIMLDDAPHLDGFYAAFGQLSAGFDSLDAIANLPCDSSDKPLSPFLISSISVNSFGIDFPPPSVLSSL